MYTLLSTYQTFKNFPKTEPVDFINIPIQIGVGKRTYEPYIPDFTLSSGEKIPFQELEEEILHDLKPKSDIRKLKDATVKENELIDYWEIKQHQRGVPVWKKDRRGIWIHSQRVQKSDVFWDRKKDGRHIEPAQIWYTRNNEKRIIPAREILDDNYGKNKERNDTIFKIRCKSLRRSKTSRGNYENLGNYYYKSDEAHRQFLEEVEQKGLVRKVEPKKSTVEIKAVEGGFNPYAFTSKEISVSSNLYQEDEL